MASLNLKRLKAKTPGLSIQVDATYNYAKYLKPDVQLDQHQIANVDRFVNNVKNNVNSLLISDDPGLGKTLSALGSVAAMRSIVDPKDEWFKVLIVAPAGVLNQWAAEIEKFTKTPPEKVAINKLNPNARFCLFSYESIAAQFKRQFDKDVNEKREIIYSKKTVVEELTLPFLRDHFKCVILDEIHKIRNPKSLLFYAHNRLGRSSSTSMLNYPMIGLSGSPIVNSLKDLWSIGQVLKFPGIFQNASFYETMDTNPQAFHTTVFIRHLKNEVFSLPKLTRRTETLTMSTEEHEVLAIWIERLIEAFNAARAKTDSFVAVLAVLMRIRQVSIHPDLPNITSTLAARKLMLKAERAEVEMEEEAELDRAAMEEDGISESESADSESDSDSESQSVAEDFDINALDIENEDEDESIKEISAAWEKSSKLRWLKENLVKTTANFTKPLILYSNFATPLRAVAFFLKQHFDQECGLYVGSANATARSRLVRKFMEGDMKILLLTYGSGGLGLNLAPVAQIIIHLDLPWAPASLQQATDRAHRRGADKPITEIVLLAANSTDAFIHEKTHVRKAAYVKKLNNIANSLRGIRVMTDAAMGQKQIGEMIGWFEKRRQRSAPKRLLDEI